MAPGKSADEISRAEFQSLVAEYPAVVGAISETKGVKPGQKTLQELDAYRYGEALRTFSVEEPPEMTLSEVKHLVEWKLYLSLFLISTLLHGDEEEDDEEEDDEEEEEGGGGGQKY
ncbi:hypothetical protein E4U54_006312 [Claviceps lovelessii]|nr:hypothetical protein E4U54_006312 [Claviceps lovelessii]